MGIKVPDYSMKTTPAKGLPGGEGRQHADGKKHKGANGIAAKSTLANEKKHPAPKMPSKVIWPTSDENVKRGYVVGKKFPGKKHAGGAGYDASAAGYGAE
jgi:hypothetical protein